MAPGTDRNDKSLIEAGTAERRGATPVDGGVNFAVYSSSAESIELCLFDGRQETARLPLPSRTGNTWHGFVPGCSAGQAYGFRAHGRFAPDEGLRFNAHKLLMDPYARRLQGAFRWAPAVYDYLQSSSAKLKLNKEDSAPFVPKCLVTDNTPSASVRRPEIPWRDMIIYEANVRGYTMQHPDIPESERGRFRGMRNGQILDHLVSLGITSLELMPVFEFIDEQHLHEIGLRNLWGYNTINFFAPTGRYLAENDVHEFREMVDAIHDAGIEVILDVVYNHTGEGGSHGPTLCYRGLDNKTYYRTKADDPGEYVNDTGCGNTLDADQPEVQALIVESLRYWHRAMGVDGFRFDLAPVLGRSAAGFRSDHPLLKIISEDKALKDVKLIAEPWDLGPHGYQLGRFPRRWAEWNDRYRDDVRRFWRGDPAFAARLARSLHGSSDIFELTGREPTASINFVASHDGFTLYDLVSYESRHNEANGEGNRDGHRHNFSSNGGVEGETDDPDILARRRQRRLNLLATLLFSQGTPMLLGGDEVGNSQQGNNNAYAQDNATGWIDWRGLEADPDFTDAVRKLIRLRHEIGVLRRDYFAHDEAEIAWYSSGGQAMQDEDWQEYRSFSVVLRDTHERHDRSIVAVLVNGTEHPVTYQLPSIAGNDDWQLCYASAEPNPTRQPDGSWYLAAESVVCLQVRVSQGDAD